MEYISFLFMHDQNCDGMIFFLTSDGMIFLLDYVDFLWNWWNKHSISFMINGKQICGKDGIDIPLYYIPKIDNPLVT